METLIANASQLLTLAGPPGARTGHWMRELGLIEGGSVLIRDGIIVQAGEARVVQSPASPGARVIDASGCVVMPGFVDPHTHPVFAGTRVDEYELRASGLSYAEIAARGGGILSTVRKTRAAGEEELFRLALRRVRWFLDHGTTTIEAKSGYGLSVADEVRILMVIRRLNEETPLDLIPTFLGAHEVPPEYREPAGSREEYLALVVEEMLPRVAAEGLAVYADVFCEPAVFSAGESRRVLSRARELGLGIRIHAEQLTAGGGARLAAELHAASADHLEWIDSEGVRLLGSAGVVAVLLPGADYNLGLSRYGPARELIEGGAAVALATDFNPGSSPTASMQMILSLACTQMKMTPAEAIVASTVNAACSLGKAASIGTLEEGRQADLVVFDCSDYREIPYFFGVNHAALVFKRGEVVGGTKKGLL